MRLVAYKSPSGPRVAAARGGSYFDLNAADPNVPACIKTLLGQGREGMQRACAALEKAEVAVNEPFELLPPVPNPEKVICVGVNYADHAAESGMATPSEPVIFNKLPTTIRKNGDPIVLPALSREVDYEAELVLVIGRGGRNIPEEHALKHVAAYCCGNDVSARDWQKDKPGGQWLLGKSFDSFGPVGPELVTADEVAEPGSLWIRLRLNGQVMQDSNTSQLIFPVEKLVSYVSGVATLSPGDLIFTGTPPGVGMARKPPVWLKPGDTVEVEIEGLGLLSNPVVAEA